MSATVGYTREYIDKTLLKLKGIFNKHLQMMDLHLHDTEEKMMNMLKEESGEDWTTDFILEQAHITLHSCFRSVASRKPLSSIVYLINFTSIPL